jgi:AraC-like DNA-binding protein
LAGGERRDAGGELLGAFQRQEVAGYSVRTLGRATWAAAGESPKQAISDRLVLEARRLLAHTGQPISRLARRLGFRDPSNFSTFFTLHTGQSPTAFRAAIRH